MTGKRREADSCGEPGTVTAGDRGDWTAGSTGDLPTRRRFLRAAGSAVTASVILGSGSGTAAGDPADEFDGAYYGNYTDANRTKDDINWIVIHTTAGSYEGAVSWFKDPESGVSAHYVIRADGYATKMVNFEDVADHTVGFDAEAIGIEHEWYEGMGPVTEAQLQTSAEIIDYVAERFDIEKRLVGPEGPCKYDSGIIRHTHAPTDASCSRTNATDCPQEYDFDRLVELVGESGDGSDPAFKVGHDVVSTAAVNVRTSAEVKPDNVRHTQPEGVRGTIANGYATADGYTWWWVEWENGVGGWSVQQYLDVTATDGSDEDGDGNPDCETVTKATKLTGSITADRRSMVHAYDPQTVAPESVRVDLSGPSDADFDVYVTTDGSEPGRKNYAARGYSKGSQESVELGTKHVSKSMDLRAKVYGYSGAGDYVLKVTETGNTCADGGGKDDETDDEAPDDARFAIGQRVVTSVDLNVRPEPTTANDPLGVADSGTGGPVTDGIVTADGYTWWKVQFTDELHGWCVERHLEPFERPALPFDTGTDLTRPVDVTAEELDDAVEAAHPGNPLVGLGDVWIEIQEQYDINAVYQAAHAAHEANWGESDIAQAKHNVYGYDAEDSCPMECADAYEDFEQCVRKVMPIVHEEYLTPGGDHYHGPDLDGMNVEYATDKGRDSPMGDPLWWKDKVVDRYEEIAEHLPDARTSANRSETDPGPDSGWDWGDLL